MTRINQAKIHRATELWETLQKEKPQVKQYWELTTCLAPCARPGYMLFTRGFWAISEMVVMAPMARPPSTVFVIPYARVQCFQTDHPAGGDDTLAHAAQKPQR